MLPRRTDTVGHAKLQQLKLSLGSLKAIGLKAGVPYYRIIRALNGFDPRTSDALALVPLGIEVSDWSTPVSFVA
jgi:hypothetical protein